MTSLEHKGIQRNTDKSGIKPLLSVLQGKKIERTPLWLMRQAGRYLPEYRQIRAGVESFLELCYTPKLAVEVTMQPIRRYDLDAAILFSDILTIPDALNQNVTFYEGKGPVLKRLEDKNDVIHLSLDHMTYHLAPVYETIRCLSSSLPPAVTLIGFAGAPWTVATYMIEGGISRDFSRVKQWMLDDKLFQPLIEILTEATTQHLLSQIAAGAEVIQIFETWAGIVPEDEFRRWVTEPIMKITKAIHESYPSIPVIAFPRGAGIQYEAFAIETNVQAVSVDSSVPLTWIIDHLQPNVVVQGNLDPSVLVAGGNIMREKVQRILDILERGSFVFNLGHGIVPKTPFEHVTQLIDVVRA